VGKEVKKDDSDTKYAIIMPKINTKNTPEHTPTHTHNNILTGCWNKSK